MTPSIILYRGASKAGEYAGSPFVAKLEARFRLGGISYKTDTGSPLSSPRGKIPYISLSNEGDATPTVMSDSSLISKDFVDRGLLKEMNANLDPTQQVIDLAIRALLEDKLYFYQVHERWIENFYLQRDSALGHIPYPIRVVVGLMVFRQINATLQGQGTGRFTVAEISAFRKHLWQQVSTLLQHAKKPGQKGPFWVLGGSQATEVDTTVFGFIVSGLVCVSAPESATIIKSHAILLDYARRIHDQYFPDFKLWE